MYAEINITWEQDLYNVTEGLAQALIVCAIANGSAEIYPEIMFMSTILTNDSGKTSIPSSN